MQMLKGQSSGFWVSCLGTEEIFKSRSRFQPIHRYKSFLGAEFMWAAVIRSVDSGFELTFCAVRNNSEDRGASFASASIRYLVSCHRPWNRTARHLSR